MDDFIPIPAKGNPAYSDEFVPVPAKGNPAYSDEFVPVPAKGNQAYGVTDDFTPIPAEGNSAYGMQVITSALNQIAEIPKSLAYGATDAYLGILEGTERGAEQIASKLEQSNRNNYNELVNSGGDPDSFRAKTFDTLGDMHNVIGKFWRGDTVMGGGSDNVAEWRDALSEKMAPSTTGFITDVFRGLGGMGTLPLDLSAAGLLTVPAQMFDEGYQQSIAEGKTGAEALDTATSYAFLASPVEMLGNVLLKKFGGKATVTGVSAIAKQALRKLGLNFISEGSTETLQDGILNKLNGKNMFNKESIRTFAVAGTIGTIVSGGAIVGDLRKRGQTVKNFENIGATPEDAIELTNMLYDGKIDEAIAFANSKNYKLSDILETAQLADQQNAPLDDVQLSKLESLVKKKTLNPQEKAELESITMMLDEFDQDTVRNALAGKNPRRYKVLVNRMKKNDTVITGPLSEDESSTLSDLSIQEDISDDEYVEFVSLMRRLPPEQRIEFETNRIRTDVKKIATDSNDQGASVLHPRNITADLDPKNIELSNTAKVLSDLYDYNVDPEQVKDAFVKPMKRVNVQDIEASEKKTKERILTDFAKIVKAWRAGEFSTAEVIAEIRSIDENLAQEVIDRTTGEQQELFSNVIKDVQSILKESQDEPSKRSGQTGTEQENKASETGDTGTEQVQASGEQKPSGTKDGEVKSAEANEQIKAVAGMVVNQNGESYRFDGENWVNEKTKQDLVDKRELNDINQKVMDKEFTVRKTEAEAEPIKVKNGMVVAIGRTAAKFKDGDWYNVNTGNKVTNQAQLTFLNRQAGKGNLVPSKDAAVETEQSKKAIADTEKKNLKGTNVKKKIREGINPPQDKVEVTPKALLKEVLRVYKRAFKEGRAVGKKEINDIRKAFRGNATELGTSLNKEINALKKTQGDEKLRLRSYVKDIYRAASDKGQQKAFEKALGKLTDLMTVIEKRNETTLVDFPAPETISGLDENSKYDDIRKKHQELGGDPKVRTKRQMLKFMNGTNNRAPTAEITPLAKQLSKRKAHHSRLLKKMDLLNRHQSGRLNMFDMINTVTRGTKGTSLAQVKQEIIDSDVEMATISEQIRNTLEKHNPKGKSTSRVMNKTVTVNTPIGDVKMGLGEIIMLDMALENKDNVKALINKQFDFSSTVLETRTFKGTEVDFREMVDSALRGLDPKTREAYDQSKKIYGMLVKYTGKIVKPVADAIMKRRGLEGEFEIVNGNYVRIQSEDAVDNQLMQVELNDKDSKESIVQSVADNYINREIFKSKNQKRTGSTTKGRIRVGTLDSELSRIIDSSSKFAASGLANDKLLLLLNNDNLKNAISESPLGSKFLDNLKEKAQQTTDTLEISRRTPINKVVSWLFSMADTWRLGRISTGMIMASSAQMIRPYLNKHSSYGKGLQAIATDGKFILEKFMNDVYVKQRYAQNSFSPDIAERGRKLKAKSGGKSLESIGNTMISGGDRAAILTVFSASAMDVLSKRGLDQTVENLKKQDQSFWDDVTKEVAGHTLRTQPSGSSAAVSVWKGRSRHDVIMRAVTRYGSQASRIYNNVVDAMEEHAYEGTKESRKKLMRVVESQVFTNTAIMTMIKTTRKATKISLLLAVAGAFMTDDEKEELTEKRDEELDKMVATALSNMGRNLGRTVEGVDDAIGFLDFLTKKHVNEPFSGIADSELQELKKGTLAFKSMRKWGKAIDNGYYETEAGKKKNITRRAAMKYYENSAATFLSATRNSTLFLARLPITSVADMNTVESKIAKKMADNRGKR